jgi:rhodanese-related sulfurtransferase
MIGFRAISAAHLALVLVACAGPSPAPAPVPKKQDSAAQPKAPRINTRDQVSTISLEDVFALQQSGKALIFDARPAFMYKLGHIPGAINLSKNHCDEVIASREPEIKSALAAGKTIVVYCSGPTCPDARTVAMHISGFGHPASIFSGGWDAWKSAELPVE